MRQLDFSHHIAEARICKHHIDLGLRPRTGWDQNYWNTGMITIDHNQSAENIHSFYLSQAVMYGHIFTSYYVVLCNNTPRIAHLASRGAMYTVHVH